MPAIFRPWRRLWRLQAIARVLARNGFGYVLDVAMPGRWRFLHPRRADFAPLTRGERLLRVIEELGPSFIKMGQIISTRVDLLPPDIAASLAHLQDDVPPFPWPAAERTIAAALGKPTSDIFAWINEQPIASASIGQVYRAALRDGRQVVVKVRRPGVDQAMDVDLDIMAAAAREAQRRTRLGQVYDLAGMVAEVRHTAQEELDYEQEARHAEHIAQFFRHDPTVRIPGVVWEYTRPRVLTMEYVESAKLTDLAAIDAMGGDRERIAKRLASALLRQMLMDGVFHADPHPGNIGVLPGDVIVFMDFGMVGRLGPERQLQLMKLIGGMARRSTRAVTQAILEMGIVPPGTDTVALEEDVETLRQRYLDVPIREISVADAIQHIMPVAFKHHIRFPPEFTLVAKALTTLDGVIRQLGADLSMVELAEPIFLEVWRQRFRPAAVLQRAWESIADHGDKLLTLPGKLQEFIDRAEQGNLVWRLDPAETQRVLGRLEAMANRLVAAIVLLALAILAGALLLAKPSLTLDLWGVRLVHLERWLLGLVGVLMLWLFVSMTRRR